MVCTRSSLYTLNQHKIVAFQANSAFDACSFLQKQLLSQTFTEPRVKYMQLLNEVILAFLYQQRPTFSTDQPFLYQQCVGIFITPFLKFRRIKRHITLLCDDVIVIITTITCLNLASYPGPNWAWYQPTRACANFTWEY